MLDRLRTRVRGLFPAASNDTTANATRQRRHDVVAGLQRDIRRLQQEIAELDEAERAGTGRSASSTDSDAMALLHRELQEKQRELSRYQARI